MAVVLSAYDLVVRVESLGDRMETFVQSVPNRTFCTDGRLARVSFMVDDDRSHFLALANLPAGSFARADLRTRTADADWLEVGRHAGVDAVWLRGELIDPLVVPLTWTPGALEFGTWDDMKEHLEYVGVDGEVETYIDKRTGKKVYTGRTRPKLSPDESARLQALRREGGEMVQPLLFKKPLGFFEKRRLKKGIALLEQVIATIADDWSAMWLLGMGLRALGEHEPALEHLRRAYAVHPTNPDVGREYAGQCLMVGAAEEGVRISRELHARFPEDVSLQSNLALALLIGGDLGEAERIADVAHQREPSDAITKNLLVYIRDVRAGRRQRPARMPGM